MSRNIRGGATSQVGQVFTWPLLLSYIVRWSKSYRLNYRRYYYKYYTQIGPMYTWTMLTKFNCQSTTHVKNAVIFYYIHTLFQSLMLTMSAYGLVLSIFVMLKLPYLNYSKSLTMKPVLNFPKGSFGQKKPVQYSFQGKWFSS